MMNKALRPIGGLLGATLALGFLAHTSRAQLATLCAQVKLEILQEATLEREAFDANLKVNNNLPDQPLTDLRVNVFVKDDQGNPADSLFFIKVATLTNVNAVDGTGVVQSSSTAEIRWLIIPSTGAGGNLPGGKRYAVKATINGTSAGAPQSVTTFDDFITVYPQPSLKLEYVLPYEVFADEPLTSLIEPIQPFPLGVRVTNVGYGTAKNFKIDSAQPKIVENKQNLQIDFKLLGTVVGGKTIPDTLLVPFGDVAPNGVGQASWIMSTTLSGRFVEFTSTFTHAAELGGQLTSLIQSVTTYTLLKDVLVDLPGRDATPDFLVNASMDRGDMQTLLDSGEVPPAEFILESDQPAPIAVTEIPAAISGALGGSNATLTLTFSQAVGSNIWVHSSVPITPPAGLVLQSARSADGRALGPKNVWISKHFRKSDLAVLYRLNILDHTSGASSYTINFDPTSLDAAPGAVADLSAVTGPEGGSLALAWSAPGEDGYAGNILGGRYMLQNSISSAPIFSPELAQVNFATSTAPGRPETYSLTGLAGNATTYLRLWTQDTGGAMSALSNAATAYVLPNPPRDLVLTAVGSDTAHGEWQGGNNNLPIVYQVYAATAPGGVVLSSSPFLDSFTRSHDFTGLPPATTVQFYGYARNPDTLTASPTVLLASTVTLPVPLQAPTDILPPRTSLLAGTPSFASDTLYATALTTFSLTAFDDALSTGDAAGVGVAQTYLAIDTTTFSVYGGMFSLIAEGTHTVSYYSVDLSSQAESTNTAAIALDLTAPITSLQVQGSSVTLAGESLLFSSMSPVALSAVDPVSNGVASGVDTIFYVVDTDPFSPECEAVPLDANAPSGTCANEAYNGPFSLSPGTHTVYYFTEDNVANQEAEHVVSVTIHADSLPPRTSLLAGAPSFSSGTLYATDLTTFSLAAFDDAISTGDAAGLGVAQTYLAVDTTTFSLSAGTFTLTDEGVHSVFFYSVDLAGRSETPQSVSLSLDLTAPISTLQVLGSAVTLTAVDPVVAGAASGVNTLFYVVDTDPFSPGCEAIPLDPNAPSGTCANEAYNGPFELAVGTHTVYYLSVDAVGNQEALHSASVTVVSVGRSVAWTGAVSGDWHNAENWSPAGVPTVDDTVVLSTNGTVAILSTSPAVTIHSLILGDSTAASAPMLLVSNMLTVSSATFVYGRATLTQGFLQPLSFGSLKVLNGGVVTHAADGSTQESQVALNVSGDFELEAGATISVSGAGFARGQGPGAASGVRVFFGGRWSYAGAGAGHAAQGGGARGDNGGTPPVAGGTSYGSIIEPAESGSGGGGQAGGAGGGTVILRVGGTLTLDGVIDAAGQDGGQYHLDSYLTLGGGGGSGGSINIRAASLRGGGNVSVDGGKGGVGTYLWGGGGAAGRIAIRSSVSDSSNLSLSASNRFANTGIGYGTVSEAGSGTIYVAKQLQLPDLTIQSPAETPAGTFTTISSSSVDEAMLALGDFVLGNSKVSFSGLNQFSIAHSARFVGAIQIQDLDGEHDFSPGITSLPSGSNVVIATMTFPVDSTLTITNASLAVSSLTALGNVTLQGNSRLTQTSAVPWTIGSLSLGEGSVLTHLANGVSKQYAVNVHVLGAMTVASGASVVADGLGYTGGQAGLAGAGLGGGQGSTTHGGGGGGHGGSGGIGHGGTEGGLPYGSVSSPDESGSGGGGSSGVVGGSGGGEIVLRVDGTLSVDGSLTAKGSAGAGNGTYGGGGGSGGTIIIAAAQLLGNGILQANGGDGGDGTAQGGGGGGGRVAGAASFTGNIAVSGGHGSSDGMPGTMFDAAAAPPSISSPVFTQVSTDALTFHWGASSNPVGTQYLAQLSKASDFSSNLVSTTTVADSASFGNLISNTVYYARVATLVRGLAATDFTVLGSTVTPRSSGETWIGASGGDWNTSSNWNNGAVPTSSDAVTIDGNVTVVTYATAPALSFSSLTLGRADGSSLPVLVVSLGMPAAGTVQLHSNATLTQGTSSSLVMTSLTMEPGSRLNHSAGVAMVDLDVSGDFDLQAGASIGASGLGFAPGQGPGFGPQVRIYAVGQWTYSGAGAGHGAQGGGAFSDNGGTPSVAGGGSYGSIVEPAELGSGGGGQAGGAGGGAIILRVGGTLTLNGVIDASGQDGGVYHLNSDYYTMGGGGGSGGSVNILAANLRGGGRVSVDGGKGGVGTYLWGGGGAAGRIALRASISDDSNLSLSASNRFANMGFGFGIVSEAGSGTVYVAKPLRAPSLAVESPAATPAGTFTPITSSAVAATSLTVDDLIVSNAKVSFSGFQQVSVARAAQFSGAVQVQDPTGELIMPSGDTSLPPGSSFVLGAITFPVVSTLTLNGATLSVSSLSAFGSVALEGASVLTQRGTSVWTIGSLALMPGSALTHAANGDSKQNMVNVRVFHGMTVAGGAVVTADGRGYAGGQPGAAGAGTGAGQGSALSGGGGAGYGGRGGAGQGGATGGTIYGSVTVADDLGSGGGGSVATRGGAGGGEVSLSVGGMLLVDGVISANGMPGGGAGSGGTIRILSNDLAGSGSLLAQGGVGSTDGGGGGGGRITLNVMGTDRSNQTVSAAGGAAPDGSGVGEVGTISRPSLAVSSEGIVRLISYSTETITIIPTGTPTASLVVAASSQGLSSVGSFYDINPSGMPFDPPATIQFGFDPTGVDTTTVAIFTFNGVSWDSATITAQLVTVYSSTSAQIVGTLLHSSVYGVLFSRPPSAEPPAFVLTPSSGPIGVSFTINGTGFGAYAGANTRLKIGLSTAPVSVWNDTTITGTIPGVSTGTYSVTLERQFVSSTGVTAVGSFLVTPLAPMALSVSSGPIGIPFTITGTGFGPYAGTLTRVLVGGATTPISVWNDKTITGTIPGISSGEVSISIERASSDGGLLRAGPLPFTVTVPFISTAIPTSGPIGNGFSLSGASFGPYAGSLTQVLIGGVATPVSVWNDATITGTIPGGLVPGAYPLVVQRRTSGGGLAASNVLDFTVVAPFGASLSVSSGPIGMPFTVTGTGFGTYGGASTVLLIGVATAPVSVWNDTTITGTIPGVSTGTYPMVVARISGGNVSSSPVGAFSVVAPAVYALAPSSGPIGVSFSLAGSGFGPYAGSLTQVLIGGATAPISVWNDATITGTIPGSMPTGIQPVVVQRRTGDGGLSESAPVSFQVTGMIVASLTPSTGPIGIPFTITGSQFGAYLGANSRVKFGATAAAISVWNDTTITGTIPALSTGVYSVAVERQQGTNVSVANLAAFTVTEFNVVGMTPVSGPIGVPFTVTGSGFGLYAGANSRILVGGVIAAVSVWNDAAITGTVPNIPSGSQPVWIERQSGTGIQSSATGYFSVTVPAVAALVSSSAPIGAPFTITGTSFGPYSGSNTRVKFDGVAAPVSVWNDTTIAGTVPGALSTGPVSLVVERAVGTGVVQSSTQAFLVLKPVISTVTPGFVLSGTLVTLSGSGFGPYAGTLTKLLVGGTTVAVSVWNDATIRWTVPAVLANGVYPLVVVRSPSGGTIVSDAASFTVGTGMGTSALRVAPPLASQPDINFEGGMNLPASEGGRIETASKAAIDIPAGALNADTVVTLERSRRVFAVERADALAAVKLAAAGEPIAFGPEGTRFAKPVTIELPYDPATMQAGAWAQLSVHYFDPATKSWEKLDSVVDRARNVVSAKTEHFSLYQALIPGGIGVLAADASFEFKDMYAFPNPVRGNAAVTIRVQPGLADSIAVNIYDASGRKVRSSSDFRDKGAYDDLNGKGAQFTYDHVWDVSGVGSGIYTYVVVAKRAGQADIRKTGRVGVVK